MPNRCFKRSRPDLKHDETGDHSGIARFMAKADRPHLRTLSSMALLSQSVDYLMAAASLWIAISAICVALIILSSRVWFLLLRIKMRMTRFDETMPFPLFDRRLRRRTIFHLSLTRRVIAPKEGKMLEKLNHAIDYLIDTYHLREFSKTLRNYVQPSSLRC